MSLDDHRCELIRDESGQVIARARVAPGISDRQRQAVIGLVRAVAAFTTEQDAADPEAAAERGRLQAAGIARVRERSRRGGVP